MKEPIYVVLSALDKYSNFNIRLSGGYFLSEQEALEYCAQQSAQDYEDWRQQELQTYHYEMENYLYPELVPESDEHKLLVSIFGASPLGEPQKPDISEDYYKEHAYPALYKVQRIRLHSVLREENKDND